MLVKVLQVGTALMAALTMGASALEAAIVQRTDLDVTVYQDQGVEIWLNPTTGDVGLWDVPGVAVALGFRWGDSPDPQGRHG